MLSHKQLREKLHTFWKKRDHSFVPPIPLVPQNDPTTLFTGSGMQQFVPYLLGEPHPQGNRLYNIQPCLRSQDIEEIGDNRHTTFFEMVGNWSLGDYFKKEQLEYLFTFLTDPDEGLGLDPTNLYATVFSGGNGILMDQISIDTWKELFSSVGIQAKDIVLETQEAGDENGMGDGRIFAYNASKNWWSRAGEPNNMPPGEPGGPDSEVFYRYPDDAYRHDKSCWGQEHPNSDSGKYIEIGNSVFMQYRKNDDGSFSELPAPNVDFGGGFERLLAVANNTPDVFLTDLYLPLIERIEQLSNIQYQESDENLKRSFRIITDHIKGVIMLVAIGIVPSNKEQGYVVRRMLRRAIWHGTRYLNLEKPFSSELVEPMVSIYGEIYSEVSENQQTIIQILSDEESKFRANLTRGMREVPKIASKYTQSSNQSLDKTATGDLLFYIYESYGFPPDLTTEMLTENGWEFSAEFEAEFQRAKQDHATKSRAGADQKFKGGLADHSERVIQFHTATHLLHQALTDVLGDTIRQEGSNITGERLRFDFHADEKPTAQQLETIINMINQKREEALPVTHQFLPKAEAEQIGAKAFFKEKYPDTVQVFFIGKPESPYSVEFCGGPHVSNTNEIPSVSLKKLEKIGSSIYRIYLITQS